MKTKRIIAAVFACAMALSLAAVSASAVDYGHSGNPSGGTPAAETEIGGESDSESEDTEEESPVVETAVPTKSVKDAIKSGEKVSISGDSIVMNKAAISAIAKAEAPVTFVNEDTGVEITIDPETITSIGSVNLGMDIKPDDTGLVIEPFMSGDFGLTMDINIPSKAIPTSVDVNNAHLFYISDDNKIEDMGALEANSDGSLTISISHASKYVISSATAEDVSAGAGLNGDGEII